MPIYADYPSQPATIVGFVYYNNWRYQSGSLTLGPAAVAEEIGGQNVSPAMALPLPAVPLRRTFPRCFWTMPACSASTRSTPRRWSIVTSDQTNPIRDLRFQNLKSQIQIPNPFEPVPSTINILMVSPDPRFREELENALASLDELTR